MKGNKGPDAACPARAVRTALRGVRFAGALCGLSAAGAAQADASAVPVGDAVGELQEVVVTAQRLELLGTASSASVGVVADQELQLTPNTARVNCWRRCPV